MLKSLTVKNVALIKEAEIRFGEKLNVLSGETGAGKSVVMECVNFALGQKADKTMIRRGSTSCSVVCEFEVSSPAVKNALEEADIEADGELIVKRTFFEDGKGSIRINGEPVTAQMLKKLTSLLVDVHGQSDHFSLLKEANQLELLDKLGKEKISNIKDRIKDKIAEIKEEENKLSSIGGNKEERARRLDYVDYCIKEIERIDFKKGEDEELYSLKKKLVNAEKIAECVSIATESLSGEGGASDLIASACSQISRLEGLSDDYTGLCDRLSVALDELADVSGILSDSLDEDLDMSRIDEVEKRLDEINSLKSKYGSSWDEIEEKKNNLIKEYDSLIDGDAAVERITGRIEKLTGEYNEICSELTAERKKTFYSFNEELTERLKKLGMPSAKFDALFEKTESTGANGKDRVTFLFTANKGEELKPLSKVISGGELSRLMLAFKSVTASSFIADTFIFDEIDSGISGEAAKIVAENLAVISNEKQIIAISHLPQVIAMADTSLLIKKRETDGETLTEVFALSEEEKVQEVLRCIGGGAKSGAALTHATETVKAAKEYKKSLN